MKLVKSSSELKSYLDEDQKTCEKNKGQVEPQQLQQRQGKTAFLCAFFHCCREVKESNNVLPPTQSFCTLWGSHWHQEPNLCFLLQAGQMTTHQQDRSPFQSSELTYKEEKPLILLGISLCPYIDIQTTSLVSRAELHKQVENNVSDSRHLRVSCSEQQKEKGHSSLPGHHMLSKRYSLVLPGT